MDGTILTQGTFTQPATAVNQTIIIPSGVDWLRVVNYTQASLTAGNGAYFYWQRGMPTTGVYFTAGTSHAATINVTAANAFVLYDPSQLNSAAINNGSTGISALTAANPAVATVGSTAGMAAGTVVRVTSLNNQPQYNGIDFSVGYGTLTGTTFSLDYLNSTGTTPSTSGNFRVINFNPLFYPRRRVITNITAAAQAVITLSVDHGFTVGQEIRLNLAGGSAIWGSYAALDNYSAPGSVPSSVTPNSWIITAVDVGVGVGHNSITINANTTGFGTFAYPSATFGAFTPPEVVPFGEDTATALTSISQQTPQINGVQIYNTNTGILADSTINTGFLGMTLAAGALLPAGVAADVVYWAAGKSVLGGI